MLYSKQSGMVQVIHGIFLSGKGIGKALMSKVAQVSKTLAQSLALTVNICSMEGGPWALSLAV